MPFTQLQTDRLLLRQLKADDNTALFALRSDDKVNRYLGRPPAQSIEDADAFIKKINDGIAAGRSYYWAIALMENSALIGTICIWNLSADGSTGEIGYELNPGFQGKGYMKEALAVVIRFAFDILKLSRIEAYTHKQNESSTKLLLKNAFVPDPEKKDPGNPDHLIFSLQKQTS